MRRHSPRTGCRCSCSSFFVAHPQVDQGRSLQATLAWPRPDRLGHPPPTVTRRLRRPTGCRPCDVPAAMGSTSSPSPVRGAQVKPVPDVDEECLLSESSSLEILNHRLRPSPPISHQTAIPRPSRPPLCTERKLNGASRIPLFQRGRTHRQDHIQFVRKVPFDSQWLLPLLVAQDAHPLFKSAPAALEEPGPACVWSKLVCPRHAVRTSAKARDAQSATTTASSAIT